MIRSETTTTLRYTWSLWAIEFETDSVDPRRPRGLIGVGWIVGYPTPEPLPHGLDGPGCALFRTRRAARQAIEIRGLRRYKARAVRVVCQVRKVT